MESVIVETLGWIASAMVVIAFGLNSMGKVSASSILYQTMNLVSGVFFVINLSYHRAYPSVVLNIVWSVIAIVALFKIIRKEKNL